MTEIILASASPRRLALLKQIGVAPDEVLPADIDENVLPCETPARYVARMARQKAEKVACAKGGDAFVLAADTAVACGNRILPKAETEKQALECLNMLSGRRHTVFGGICLITPDGRALSRVVRTAVVFARLSDAQKRDYLDGGEWRGKAGGYAIQGKAAVFARQIMGSYSNVVGLSLYETANLLNGNGVLI